LLAVLVNESAVPAHSPSDEKINEEVGTGTTSMSREVESLQASGAVPTSFMV